MKIKVLNAEEAGMPADMIANCEQLLQRRITKKHTNIQSGDNVEILYSESDPLMTKENWGEDAYAIYYTVVDINPKGESDVEKLDIHLNLMY